MEIPTEEWSRKVFSLTNEQDFDFIALELFRFQFTHNPVYQQFATLVGRTPNAVTRVPDIPFLPISLFKSHRITAGLQAEALLFESSGTTGAAASRHYVLAPALYEESFLRGFAAAYGPAYKYCILGLLPSYLERGQSSLVYMVDRLIRESGHPQSGFYLHDHERLHATLEQLETSGQPTLLIGVTYALLDFADRYPRPLRHTLVMETGGMKGRRRELTRAEVHGQLQAAFGLEAIHSEYGMTELLSQAYAEGSGLFRTPPWLRAGLRDERDPLTFIDRTERPLSGALSLIDLANVYSCAFLATEDVGRLHPDGQFEVLGRLDNSDVRGCSLMTTEAV